MAIRPNQNIYLYIETYSGTQVYRTRVEDVYDNIVIVAAPIEQGTLVPIRLGTELNIEYKDTSAKSQGRYRAPAIVETRQRGQVATISLRLVGEWQKIQDRQFVRVDVFIEATYALVLDDEVQGIRTCIVRNLSGGGLWMDAEEELCEGDFIWICLPLEQETIQTYGEIVRKRETETGFGYGVSFINLPESERKTAIRYVYQRQLELHRKGLLDTEAGGS